MKGKRLIVILLLVILALGGGAAGFYFIYPTLMQPAAAAQTPPEPKFVREQAPGTGPMYALEERVYNLADRGTRRYLKLGVTLEFQAPSGWEAMKAEEREAWSAELNKSVEQALPVLKDKLMALVTTTTSEELADMAGKEALKDELRNQINALIVEPKVVYVYFTEFLMQ